MEFFTITSNSLEDTTKIAEVIAPFLTIGDAVIFEGNLGTGKTHFVKFLSAALGYTGLVNSPTYTIASVYEMNDRNILHIDGYRLTSLSEFVDLGLDTYFPKSIALIEWGDEFAEEFSDYLKIKLQYEEAEMSRKITISKVGDRWEKDFETIKNKLQNFNK